MELITMILLVGILSSIAGVIQYKLNKITKTNSKSTRTRDDSNEQ
jgi:cell division protein FtsL